MSGSSRAAAAATAAGATAFLLLYRGAPTAFDEWLALPIALETARPGTYATGDLLVQESVHGPFHLYKAASVLYTLGVNVDAAWYALLILSLLAFFLALWRLGGSLGLDRRERAVLVFAVAVSPVYRGTLHWSAQPMLSFITASVAVPIGLLAVAAALDARLRTALLLSALAFDLHPSLGLCAGVTALGIVPGSFDRAALRRAWLPAIALALPNVVYLLMHLPAPSVGDGTALWNVHRTFGYHTFVQDHADGYPWYALALAVALAAPAPTATMQRARRAVVGLSALAIGWIAVMNVAPVPALLPLYLIRATWLVKPLVVGLAIIGVARHRYAGRYSALAPLVAILAVAHPDRMIAEASLALLLGMMLRHSAERQLAAVGFAAWLAGIALLLAMLARKAPALDPITEVVIPLRWVAMGVGLVAAALLMRPAHEPTIDGVSRPGWAMWMATLSLPVVAVIFAKPFGPGWLPDSFAQISRQWHLSRPLPAEAGVMQWARERTPQQALFAVPPVDQRWVRFRLAAQRGVYASVHDINQLMYVRNRVLTAVDRLHTLGVGVRSPHRFDPRPYLHPSCARLGRLAGDGVDYYIVPSHGSVPPGSVVPYRDDAYVVIDVRRTAPSCAGATGG